MNLQIKLIILAYIGLIDPAYTYAVDFYLFEEVYWQGQRFF